MSKLLHADLTNETLRRTLGGTAFSFPTLAQKSTLSIGLRFSEQIGTRHVVTYPTIHEIRATIGGTDQRPEAGEFSLKVGTDSPVLGTNLTVAIGHGLTADQLATALNALSIVGTAVVVEDDDSFLVTGIPETISVFANTLRPISFVRILSYEVDGSRTQAIRLQRAPFAFTDVYDQRVPEAPFVERVQAGGEVDSIVYPEIQKLTIPLDFDGSYRLRRNDPVRKSPLLGVGDGPEEIATALNPTSESVALADDIDGLFVVEEHPTDPASLISFEGSMLGTSPDEIIVEVFDPKPGDYWLHLNLDTAMTAEAFRAAGVDLLRRIPIEIFADIEGDDEVVRTVTVYQGEVSIRESVTHSDLATAQHVDWINPPTAKFFAPVSPESLSSGTRFFPFLFGNGSYIESQITHSLASPRCKVHLRENITGGRDLVHGTDFEVVHDDDDALTITLLGDYASSPPALNALTGTVQDLTLTSTWLMPVGIQITDVANLRAELDAIIAELANLTAQSATNPLTRQTITGIVPSRYLGTAWKIPRARTNPPKPASLIEWTISSKDLGEKPSRPLRLLPAVHDASVETIPAAPLPVPSSTFAGSVFTTATARPDFPGGGLQPGDFAACDGREWYRVDRIGSESSYYPVAFDSLVFETAVNESEFPLGSRLDLDFGFEAMVLMLEQKQRTRRSACSWVFILEAGSHTADATPGTPGANLAVGFANPITLLEQRIVLTEIPTAHTFGVSVSRSSAGVITALARKYGSQIATTAPSSANLALRGRFHRFDTENAPTDARGIVAYRGLDVALDGQPDNTLGYLTITK